ncbi:uncharacterized protein VTP21DRAFT_8233 [Calcarisporiella thermophila]|uniref:uncharacterized protein n=1 Tax=Calcarisporiella thermophila TaxID=911321 RepID=UPI0037446732
MSAVLAEKVLPPIPPSSSEILDKIAPQSANEVECSQSANIPSTQTAQSSTSDFANENFTTDIDDARRIKQQQSRTKKILGAYTLTKTLGAGSMGKVKLGVHNTTGEKFAIKIIPRTHNNSGGRKSRPEKNENREIRTIREGSIMLLLHHPYIVGLREMMVLPNYYYMVFEFVDGAQLLDYIISHGKIKEKQARKFIRQIVSALDYCHRNSIVHRDLKIENILISKMGDVKIIDFGLSNLYSPDKLLSTFCGSLYFAAPELLNAKMYTGPEVDIWSLGIVLYVLVCGKVPFDDQSMPALHAKIKRGIVEYPNYLSSECKHLISRMLVTDPSQRATLTEIMEHPWLNRGFDTKIKNYLPYRLPLSLPLDMDVIRGMTGFEFGTEQEIRRELEAIVTSDTYQRAAKQLAQNQAYWRSVESVAPSSMRNNSTVKTLFNKQMGGGKTPPPPPPDDPITLPEAYHPLISIYHLVREKQERERQALKAQAEQKLRQQQAQQQRFAAPQIPLPDPLHATNGPSLEIDVPDLYHPPPTVPTKERRRTLGRDERPSIFSREEPSSPSKSDGSVFKRLGMALGRTSLDGGRRPTFKGQHSRHPSALSAYATPSPQLTERDSVRDSEEVGDTKGVTRAVSLPETEYRRHRQRPSSIGGSWIASAAASSGGGRSANTKAPAVELPKVSIPQQQSSEQFTSPQHTNNSYPFSPTTPTTPSSNKQRMEAKPVFLKGLFSVATTSTKPALQIRSNVEQVLNQIGVQYHEIKGGYECLHLPSIDLASTQQQVQQQQSLMEFDLLKNERGKIRGGGGEYRESFEEESTMTSQQVAGLILRFEVHIVRVPWLLGMHGVQFHRISGDAWQYRKICSRILADLKL